jgi:hypothetical protein
VPSTSPSGCQAQGVCKYTKLEMNVQYKINKYANATAPENLLLREYANKNNMQCNGKQ